VQVSIYPLHTVLLSAATVTHRLLALFSYCTNRYRFRFLYHPEFIIRGAAVILREQRTRGVGTIASLL
jgi:GTPase